MQDQEPEPRHGERGWDLCAYDWDEVTGMGTFQYQRSAGHYQSNEVALVHGKHRSVSNVRTATENVEVRRQQMVPAPRPKYQAQGQGS